MSSELGQSGKRAMKALANQLGIIDVKQAPGLLKTDELTPVIAADAGWASYEVIRATGFGNFGVGEADITLTLTGPPNNPGDPVLLENNAGDEVLIYGFTVRTNWNAVAAAALAGKYMNTYVTFSPDNGNTYYAPFNLRRLWQISVADPVFTVGPNMYFSPASGGGGAVRLIDVPFWIPAGMWCQVSVYFDDGSTFVSGGGTAAWAVEALGIKVPRGVKPPCVP